MAQKDLEEVVTTTLQLWRTLGHNCFNPSDERSVSWLHALALGTVHRHSECPMSTLANALQASLSSTTQLVERLTQAGLVERHPDKTDRRITCVSLTEKGKEEVLRLKKDRRERVAKLFANIPDEDIRTLIRIQKMLIETLNATN